ncbi:MAG: hypothetical protein JW940_23550 [Polyangiaceae bacterium]|nr:hypothetical protein [Polyangiaceae bacterium]
MAASFASAAEHTARPGFAAHPVAPEFGQWTLALGLGVDVLPRRLVESEWRQLPHAWVRSRAGAGKGWYLSGRANVVIIDDQFQLGAGWGQAYGGFAWGLHDHVGVTWGTVGVEGFDATAWALAHSPGFSVAYPLRAVQSTLTVEALILHARHITVGEVSLTQKGISLQGASFALTFESPVGSRNAIFYGLAAIYAKPDYQLWLAFSDAEARQLYPRFFVGYVF